MGCEQSHSFLLIFSPLGSQISQMYISFWLEKVHYYSNIVGMYGIPVQNALKKLAGVELDYICFTHGPVWHEHIEKVIGMYDKLLAE